MKIYEETLDLMNDFADGVVQLNKMSDSDLSNIIVALRKQIPKKPDYIADGYADGLLCYDYAQCPICGYYFEYGINDWESDYCSDCGQKLDWT